MTTEQQYIKGFNHGYILAEHEPDLAKQIVKSTKSENQYFKGLVSGKQEYDIEKIKGKLKRSSKNGTQNKNVDRRRKREK